MGTGTTEPAEKGGELWSQGQQAGAGRVGIAVGHLALEREQVPSW